MLFNKTCFEVGVTAICAQVNYFFLVSYMYAGNYWKFSELTGFH